MSDIKTRLGNLSEVQLDKLKSLLINKETPKAGAIKFSLFFFSDSGSSNSENLYDLLLKCAKFGDEHDFHSVWIPERHFHEFGGPYASPTILLAAIAMTTSKIKLRSGSVVLPLHHPAKVAEEWSMLDNLSNGRIGLSIASGWNQDDFILSNSDYSQRKEIMFNGIKAIKALWRGEKILFSDVNGRSANIAIFPKPVSKKLPIWITSAGNPETWINAGKIGANILTGLMEQTVEDLGEKIALYKQSLQENGFNPETREISVMLHTYIGKDLEQVKETVKPALKSYLKTHLSAYETHLNRAQSTNLDLKLVSEKDKETLIELGFERYFNSSGLLGTVNSSQLLVNRLKNVGVTEVCCLVNFGLDDSVILEGLEDLNLLKEKVISDHCIEAM